MAERFASAVSVQRQRRSLPAAAMTGRMYWPGVVVRMCVGVTRERCGPRNWPRTATMLPRPLLRAARVGGADENKERAHQRREQTACEHDAFMILPRYARIN